MAPPKLSCPSAPAKDCTRAPPSYPSPGSPSARVRRCPAAPWACPPRPRTPTADHNPAGVYGKPRVSGPEQFRRPRSRGQRRHAPCTFPLRPRHSVLCPRPSPRTPRGAAQARFSAAKHRPVPGLGARTPGRRGRTRGFRPQSCPKARPPPLTPHRRAPPSRPPPTSAEMLRDVLRVSTPSC